MIFDQLVNESDMQYFFLYKGMGDGGTCEQNLENIFLSP